VLLALVLLVLLAPDACAAAGGSSGNDIGKNLGGLFKHYAGELYGGLAAITSVVFLWNRRYTELATFVVAAIVVGFLVFAPGSIGAAAKALAQQIFG